jgi:hypothetical protein
MEGKPAGFRSRKANLCVCVVNAASGFRLYSRPVTLSPLLEVSLAGKGYASSVQIRGQTSACMGLFTL